MPIPNVSERMKEAPAHALRVMFAGIGQALLISDRMRRRLRGEHAPGPVPHAAKVPVTKPAGGEQASEVTVARPAAERPAAERPAATVPAPEAPTPEAPAATVPAATAPAGEQAAPPAAAKAAATAKGPAAKGPAAEPTTKTPTPKPTETPTAKRAGAARPPIPDYDKLSIPSLRARLRGLDMVQVQRLLDYERAHARRSDVITMYERRLKKLIEETRR